MLICTGTIGWDRWMCHEIMPICIYSYYVKTTAFPNNLISPTSKDVDQASPFGMLHIHTMDLGWEIVTWQKEENLSVLHMEFITITQARISRPATSRHSAPSHITTRHVCKRSCNSANARDTSQPPHHWSLCTEHCA